LGALAPGNLGFFGDLGTPVFVFINLFSGTSSFTQNLGTQVKPHVPTVDLDPTACVIRQIIKVIKYAKSHAKTSKQNSDHNIIGKINQLRPQ
jgi:hypothetical protein